MIYSKKQIIIFLNIMCKMIGNLDATECYECGSFNDWHGKIWANFSQKTSEEGYVQLFY